MKSPREFFKPAVFYLAIPAAVSLLLILKVFLLPGCFAFDANDDAKHTFIGLSVARQIMATGHLPLVNLYNSFGAPLLGDCLTFPFSIQSLTYALLPGPVAMTLNRALIAFLTLALLTHYLRRSMALVSASVCALLVFFSPPVFWNFAHHHYQMALLFATGLLFLEEKWIETSSRRFLFGFYAVFVVMFYSLSINIVLILTIFLTANFFFLQKKFFSRTTFIYFLTIFAAACAAAPELVSFARQVPESARVEQWYGIPFTTGELLRNVLFAIKRESLTHPHQLFVYFSWLLLLAAAAALICLFRERKPGAWRFLILGVVPVVFILFCMRFQTLYASIPLFRSTDITRFFWISNIFLMTGIGMLLDRTRGWGYGILVAGLLMTRVPVATFVLGLDQMKQCHIGHWYSESAEEDFVPIAFMAKIHPYSRLAAEVSSVYGQDFKAAKHHILGSMGRAPLLHRGFIEYLMAHDMIAVEEKPIAYHFKSPWDAKRLAELGICYTMRAGPSDQGWPVAAQLGPVFLYENPEAVSLAYFLQGDERTPISGDAIRLEGNGLKIDLPQVSAETTLVATFIARSGWKARVDGEERKVSKGENQLIRVLIKPGDRRVEIFYAPFTALHFAGAFSSSAIILSIISWGMVAMTPGAMRRKTA